MEVNITFPTSNQQIVQAVKQTFDDYDSLGRGGSDALVLLYD